MHFYFRFLSSHCFTLLSDLEPVNSSITFPFLNILTQGILVILNLSLTVGASSTLTFARMNLPLYSASNFSSTGLSILHGIHHSAQKSTTIGIVFDCLSTFSSK